MNEGLRFLLIAAKDYFKLARRIFEEMQLHNDLEELEKIMID